MSARRMLGLLACTLILAVAAVTALADEWEAMLDEANWIAHTNDATVARGETHFFSKDIDIGQAKVRRAVLRVTGESNCKIVVNDTEVGSNENWHELEEYDIKPFLVPGKNSFPARTGSSPK